MNWYQIYSWSKTATTLSKLGGFLKLLGIIWIALEIATGINGLFDGLTWMALFEEKRVSVLLSLAVLVLGLGLTMKSKAIAAKTKPSSLENKAPGA